MEVDHLLFVRGARDYAALHTSDGATHFHEKSLTALEQMLPPRFVRVHRSYLVDTERVRSLQSFGGGRHRLILQGDHEIPVSRERVARVRELLSEE